MITIKAENCISCAVKLTGMGFTRFPCPDCGEVVGRCAKCRGQSNPYKCPTCKFMGP